MGIGCIISEVVLYSFFCYFSFMRINWIRRLQKLIALQILPDYRKGRELVSTYLKLAKEYVYINPDKAARPWRKSTSDGQGIEKARLGKFGTLDDWIRSDLCRKFCRRQNHLLMKVFGLPRKINHVENICTGLNVLAAYHMNTGDYNKAISLFYECADQAKKGNLERQEAMVRFNIGAILTNMGKWSKGLKEFKYALEYFKKIGDESYVSRTLTNIAVNYSSWGDYEMSLSYYKKSLEALKSVGDLVSETSVLNNMGEIYKDTGDYEKALEYYQKAYDTAMGLNSKLHEAVPLIGLGEAYWLSGKLSLAEKYSNEALEISFIHRDGRRYCPFISYFG